MHQMMNQHLCLLLKSQICEQFFLIYIHLPSNWSLVEKANRSPCLVVAFGGYVDLEVSVCVVLLVYRRDVEGAAFVVEGVGEIYSC